MNIRESVILIATIAIAFMLNVGVVWMMVEGRLNEVPAVFWGIYGPVMSVLGIPLAFQGIKAAYNGLKSFIRGPS
ncbi:MAG: hypothetical protein PHW65_01600 [Dehalococcoidales bacterium]|nr:hypothetical protein [Dehalococcoidales bacterium]